MQVVNAEQSAVGVSPDLRRGAYDALVLDAVLRQSLVTLRSLGGRGLSVAALETSAHSWVPAFSSRWCGKKIVCPADEGTESYLAHVEQELDLTGARVVITSSDGTLALLRKQRERLERRARVALASEAALETAVSKEQTLAVARQLRIGVPRGVTLSSMDDVPAAIREIGLPVVIKPSKSWVWGAQSGVRFGAQLVTTLSEAQYAVERPVSMGGKVLLQQFLAGRREAVSMLYAEGEVYAHFAQWAKRMEPQLGGVSVLRQSIAVPDDIGDQAERLVRSINLEGYSEVEFRRDSAGAPYLMEINPRLSASVEMAVRAGVDFPYLLYQWANGDHIDRVREYRKGGWMRYLRGDFFTTLEALKQRGRPEVTPAGRALYDFLSSFFIPMGYDYIRWNDPFPAFVASADFMVNRIGMAAGRRVSRLVRWV